MKVLLLHEMSGVHTELKKGLLAIGVEAQIATFGDGWKSYKLAELSAKRLIKQDFLVRLGSSILFNRFHQHRFSGP